MNKKKKSHVPFRLNMLFFLVFILFSTLILRLGVVQIVHGEKYQKKVEETENSTVNTPVPRGKIYDRFGRVVVDNTPLNAITYTRAQGAGSKEVLDVAEKLSTIIEKNVEAVKERDLKDYWLLTREAEAEALLTEEDWDKFENDELTDNDLYKLQLDRITEDHLKEITAQELEVVAIFREMNKGYALTPQIVKNEGVTDKEYAIVSERLEDLPGVDTTTDWKREYNYGSTIKSILGNTTEGDEGLPSEKLDYYLARGYDRNDRVGKSYLEAQYEDVLSGQKAIVENITQGNSLISTNVIAEGQRGRDLILTIDMDLQKAVEQILEENLRRAKQYAGSPYLDRAFVVMMDPKTGEVLTMAGKKYTKDENGKVEFLDFALGAMNTAYEMGSSVKGASVLTGFETGVIQPGSYLYDEPLYIKSTPVKKSWTAGGMGSINDLTALKRSSNVYMFKIGIGIADGVYRPHQSLPIDLEAFSTVRNYFSQFGLGVKTGIDLPGETAGLKGVSVEAGKLLDLMIGQFDTYTPLQMAQYVSTIANGGYRMQPKIVREIRQPTLNHDEIGPILEPFKPTVLNRIDMDSNYIKRVQEGFRQVMQVSGGTAVSHFGSKSYNPAGKTGTAQAVYYNSDTGFSAKSWNLTLVGYAPFDNPEVAFSVVVPWAYQNSSSFSINNEIGKQILDKYFELKSKARTDQSDIETTDEEETE